MPNIYRDIPKPVPPPIFIRRILPASAVVVVVVPQRTLLGVGT